MKLRVVELLLVTTVPALFLASNGIPKLSTTIATLLGGTFAAGSANAFNMVIEIESDKLMARTAARPIITGKISKNASLVFAFLTGTISIAIFFAFTTLLADFPMLPVVAPMSSVVKQMWFHSTFMAITAIAVLVSADFSVWLVIATAAMILGWKAELTRLTRSTSDLNAGRLFNWSITFLSIYSLFIVIGVLLK
ncbi:MAG: protoheme IX farnesyltransferase [Actinobacteria bacterium]|nr:protoheme IX farnesyltransferase [Actinomycetota bacterium]